MLLFTAMTLAFGAEPVAEPSPRLDVTGVGEVYVAPDEAVLTLGVRAEAERAGDAFDAAAASMRTVVETVGALVAQERIRTTRLALEPRYDYDAAGGAPRLVGYEATATLEIRVDEPGDVGAVLDAAVAAGANEVVGIGWVVEDENAVRQQALDAAVDDARTNAQQVAEELGVTLGAPLSVRIRAEESRPPPVMYERAAAEDTDGGMPVLGGEQTYRAEVDVTFRLGDAAEPQL